MNTVGVRPLIDFELFAEGDAREDNKLRDLRQSGVIRHVGEWETHLETPDQIGRDFLSWGTGEDPDWDIGVEFSQPGVRGLGPWFSNI